MNDDKMSTQTFTMSDLNQDVMEYVVKYWSLKERVVFRRTSQTIGDSCQVYWSKQTSIKPEDDFDISEGVSSYHKMVLLCPNLKEFNISRCTGLDRFFSSHVEYNRMEYAKILAEACPRIEKFDTGHSWEVIIAYLKIRKDDNRIKSLKMILDDPDVREFPKHIDFMAECLQNHLETLNIEAEDWESSEYKKASAALKNLGSNLKKIDADKRFYKYLSPGEKLEVLGSKFRVQKLAPDFSIAHPNLKRLEGKQLLTSDNLMSLMPLKHLTRIVLDGTKTTRQNLNKSILSQFLSSHQNLKRLDLVRIEKMDFSDIWLKIGSNCPNLEYLKISRYYPIREANRRNLLVGLCQLIRLKELVLDRIDHDGFSGEEVNTLFDTLVHLKKVSYRPSRYDDEFEDFDDNPEGGVIFQDLAGIYLMLHPDRKITIKVWDEDMFPDEEDDSSDEYTDDSSDGDDDDDSDDSDTTEYSEGSDDSNGSFD